MKGASGVLGTAVKTAFERSQWDVLGLAYTRASDGLEKLDLTDFEAVKKRLKEFKPDCKLSGSALAGVLDIIPDDLSLGVIHCAAERRPDVAEKVGALQELGDVY